jgi:hypothetical protein
MQTKAPNRLQEPATRRMPRKSLPKRGNALVLWQVIGDALVRIVHVPKKVLGFLDWESLKNI